MSVLVSRKLIPLVVLILLIVLPFLWARSPSPAVAAAIPGPDASKLLQTHDETLTAYLGGATSRQDICPRAEQRGVNLDGTARSSSTLPMHFAANPFGSPWNGTTRVGSVELDTGAVSLTEVDIALPADGPSWIIARSYGSRQYDGAHHDSDGYQGANWAQLSQPELVLYEDPSDDAEDAVYIVMGPGSYLEFWRYSSSSTEYRGVNGCAGVVQYQSGSPDLWVYTDQWGYQFSFFGGNTGDSGANWQFWKVTDPDGLSAYVGDASAASTAVSAGFSSNLLIYAYDSEDRRYTYGYDGNGRLTEVKAETKSGGTWASPTGVETVAEVDYAYYGAESYGDPGDLKTVTITETLSDTTLTKVKYFRYWEGTFNASTNPGHPHALMRIVDFEGARRFDWEGDSSFDGDYETASEAALESYSHSYFEYDSDHRVVSAVFNGDCGCGGSGGSGSGTYEFTYGTNGSYSDGTGYDTTWARRTVVERPDATFLTQAFDEVGQSLHQVVTDTDPSGSPSSTWVTSPTRDSSGCVTELSKPDNVTGYTHSTGAVTASTSAGLVWQFTLETTGDDTGFLLDTKYSEGTSGTAYYQESRDYTTSSLTVGDVTVVRPVVDDEKRYVNAVSGTPTSTDYEHTQYTVGFYSAAGDELMIEEIETDHPIVSTGNNGSGSQESSKQHFTLQGRVDWEEATDGMLTRRDFSAGQVSASVQDASSGATLPSAWTFPTGAVHRDESHTYDDQGRRETSTLADGRVTKTYVSKLADRRKITLSYPKYVSGTSTYHGPFNYSVTNLAGQTEASGVVGLTTSTAALSTHVDETDSDPLLAIGIGTVDRLTKTVFDDSGTQRQESWAYFDIPSSGNGSEGTNYDATYFGFDSMGRPWRTKEPSGTIRRTTYDTQGRTSNRWIGTNDSTFSGGESSGTDDMVITELLEYDGNSDGGLGLLTERTLRVQDSSTDERVTTYEYDLRGNLILQLNPTAPHVLNKVDNLGRVIVTSQYSATTGLDTSSNPTTLATNRMSMRKTAYDERGRVWRNRRHEIDPTDGSNVDNFNTLTWYDSEGRVIKVDGESLTKTAYDRLGRVTHRFTLAVDDDTVHADADDVSGDIVLQEDQTGYESTDSDDVWVRATISRFHDDYGGSETTGALDTNADADALAYAAANLEGRIQISAMWYDALGRLVDTVQYGTYGGSTWTRPTNAPTRSDTELRTTYAYWDDGDRKSVTDSRDLETRYEYDDAGRQTLMIRNYVDGSPSGATGDDDVQLRYVYADGLRTKYWVDIDGDNIQDTSGDQITTYTHGTTKGTSAGDSKIGTGHLPHEVKYPDSTGSTDVVSYAYNAQGQEIWRKDQYGNVLEKDYDDSGRLEHDRATTVASGYDGDIRRITTSFDGLGRREEVVQYDNATAGSGTAQDGVKFTYEGWGNISKYEQDNNSEVGASGSVDDYEVSYTYEKHLAGRNTIRRKTQTLPSGAGYSFQYSETGSRHDNDVSRVTAILEGISPSPTTAIVNYEYLGLGQLVGTEYPTEDIKRERFGSTSGSYDALDRFDRIVEDKWVKDLTNDVAIYHVDLTYDRNSNILTMDEVDGHVGFDWKYTMDGLDRLTDAQRGTLSGGSISSEQEQQTWVLDQVGNWEDVTLDFDDNNVYTGTNEYDDDRVHNEVNELTSRDIDDDETPDYTLSYDGAGNLTDDGESYKYVYDVWYRLRDVNDQSSNLVVEHRYNGLGHRIAEHADTDEDDDVDANDDWHHLAYDERWRLAAMFVESDTAPTEEFVHHAAGRGGGGSSSYIDEVVLRDRDTDDNGSLDERLWYLQNWRADVVALIDDSGDQREMTRFSPYGVPFGLPSGDADSDGDNDDGDAVDSGQIQVWIDEEVFDLRGDITLDGTVSAADKSSAMSTPLTGQALARGELSSFENRAGLGGIPGAGLGVWHIRHRVLSQGLGAWLSRDPLEVVDGPNQYGYVANAPLNSLDPMGLYMCFPFPPLQSSTKTWCGGLRTMLVADFSQTTITIGACNKTPCGSQGDLQLAHLARIRGKWTSLESLKELDRNAYYRACRAWHGPSYKLEKDENGEWVLLDPCRGDLGYPQWDVQPPVGSGGPKDGRSNTRIFNADMLAPCGAAKSWTIRSQGWATTCQLTLTLSVVCSPCPTIFWSF